MGMGLLADAALIVALNVVALIVLFVTWRADRHRPREH
jgi:hypothetical protein